MPAQLIAANWKMNMLPQGAAALAEAVLHGARAAAGVDVALCPPAPLLGLVGGILSTGPVALGGQDCHAEASGAHTGDTSAELLAALGCRYVITGHSERRADHGEDDGTVRAKTAQALAQGLTPILCIGETLEQRDSGDAEAVVAAQLQGSLPEGATAAQLVVAYEPVWAIGTGRTASEEDIAAMHAAIRRTAAALMPDAAALRILYGGSVKPGNAAAILGLADVGGALVGGASLKAEDFLAIIGAARAG